MWQDRLALVAFDQDADTVLRLTAMTTEGKATALTALEALKPRGQTNLWGGMMAGMDALKADDPARRKVMLVLTDGKPNIAPPRGHLRELRGYKDKNPGLKHEP